MVYIEPTLHKGVIEVLQKEPQSSSTYLRALVLRDLLQRGLITNDEIAEALGGAAA
jgi:hypothetical protein